VTTTGGGPPASGSVSGSATGEWRPRVLRIIARMNVGGPAWQVSVLTRGLDDFETVLVAGDVEPGEADFVELRDPTLPVHRVPVLGRSVRLGDDLRALVAIRRAIRDFHPDVVHTHTAKAGLLGRLAAFSCRVPVIVHTFHGHVLHGYFRPVVARAIRILESILARRTTALVAVGSRVRDELVTAGVGRRDQYAVVPPGVAPAVEVDRGVARRQHDLPADRPVVLFVGRLTAVKRVDRLLEAMTIVRRQLPGAVLAIAGEGDLLDDARRSAASAGDSVRFLGWQPELGPLYAAADLVVLTSDNEGMPVTLIEAAMAGVPGVTTDVGSAREVVVDGVTGRVVSVDAGAVAAAIVELLGSHGLAAMGDAARRHAEECFGTDRLVADHRDLYRRLLAG